MRHALIILCIFSAACSGQPFSATSPSHVADVGARGQASGGPPVEVTFTKWGTGGPGAFTGVTGGDVPGTIAGTVLGSVPFDNGTIVQLEAEYAVTGDNPAHSFAVHIEGKRNNPTQQAVLNGTVISGWLAGAQVHFTFDVIAPAAGFRCVPEAPLNTRCLQGTIRILPGSAN